MPVADLPTEYWQRCQILARKMRIAGQQQWDLALARLNREFHEQTCRLQAELGRLSQNTDYAGTLRDNKLCAYNYKFSAN